MERISARLLSIRLPPTRPGYYYISHPTVVDRGHNLACVRCLSQRAPSNKQRSFFDRVFENIKSEFSQNKELKENLEKFRKETQKLEETDAIKQARKKYEEVQKESSRDVNEILEKTRDTLKSGVEKAKAAEFVKKTINIGDKISSTAKGAAEELSKGGDYIKDTSAFKSVEQEIDNADILSSLYKAPQELLKRAERAAMQGFEERQVQPNENVQSVDLHKDSKWAQSWKKFKEDNPYVNTAFDLKMKFDESDNPLVRVTRNVFDKVSDTVGALFQSTDTSTVLTEICKVDPSFDLSKFLVDCEKVVVPTILESMIQNRHDVLADWCSEAVFNVLHQPYKQSQQLGLKIHSKILDIQSFELAMGKMMDQGPVLIVSFQAHQVSYVTDSKANVVEGDKDSVVQNTYVMAFCRDQTDMNPYTAWRLIDVAIQQSQLML